MSLTPAERQRIYEEEKARLEARERAIDETIRAHKFSIVRFLVLAVFCSAAIALPAFFLYFILGLNLGEYGPIIFIVVLGLLAAAVFYRGTLRPL